MLKGLIWSRNTTEEKWPTKSAPVTKMAIGTYISIITLNVNGLNASTKTGQLHVKNEIRTLPNTIHKEKPKID